MKHLRQLLGISLLWLPLSMLSDGIASLILPGYLLMLTAGAPNATVFGLITFVGLLVGMLVQPVAGAYSDRFRPRWGRRGFIGIGITLTLLSIILFDLSQSLLLAFTSFLFIQVSMNVVQAGQQGFIPDKVPLSERGRAAGLKNMMDIGGAFLAFYLFGQLLEQGQFTLTLAVIGITLIVAFLLTAALVREDRESTEIPSSPLHLRSIYQLNWKQHRTFAQLVSSRFLFLLGTYAVGRFLLYFVADRLSLDATHAIEQAGSLLAILTLLTVIAAVPAGWAVDKFGRLPLMWIGAFLSALGVLLLIASSNEQQILLFGSLMSLGSAAFASANWAFTADVVPKQEAARYFAFANFGTAGASAVAGLFGILVDAANNVIPGSGYSALFVAAAFAFLASALALRGIDTLMKQSIASQSAA